MNRPMRVKLIGVREQILTLEAPPGVDRATDHAFAVHHHPSKRLNPAGRRS